MQKNEFNIKKVTNYFNVRKGSIVFKNLSTVLLENIITKSLNFIIILILARKLGPEGYGKYSFIYVSVIFCSAFFDFGMENTAVRFAVKEKENKESIFGIYILVKVFIISLFTTVIILFGGYIFTTINKANIIVLIPYFTLGFIGESLFFVNDTYLQSVQMFKLRAFINVIRNFICLLFIIVLYTNNNLSINKILYLYLIPLGFTLFFSKKYILFIQCYFKRKLSKNVLKELFNYEKWMFILSITNNILTRIDFFMLSFWVGYYEIGIYNAAFQLTSIVSFLPYCLGKVLLPKMSEMESNEVFEFHKRIVKPMAILTIIVILLIPLARPVVPILFGEKYEPSILILQILIFAFAVNFITVPYEQALYSLGKPKVISSGKVIQVFTIIILNIIFIPKFGALWAAISVLIARLIFGGVLAYLFSKCKKDTSSFYLHGLNAGHSI